MFHTKLTQMCRDQERFSQGYAPLYGRIFAVLTEWLESPQATTDPVVRWLLEVGHTRQPLVITNLLVAGLHREILANAPSTARLATFYPTVGGNPDQEGLAEVLREAILANLERLTPFLQTANVQTNETGRGLVWLLPLLLSGWETVHLVDLGASAGLNLLADYRHYRLVANQGTAELELGLGKSPQFVVQTKGELEQFSGRLGKMPAFLTRTGGDLYPFYLRTNQDHLTLLSYVWADHTPRLARLGEAMAALHSYQGHFQLLSLDLPAGLPSFLTENVPADPHPVLIYNTYVTAYLSDKGQSLRERIGSWAKQQPRPVLWVQWEPPVNGVEPPGFGWCGWTADYWHGDSYQQHQLGWVHPHGTEFHILDWSLFLPNA